MLVSDMISKYSGNNIVSLNPCFSGCWSRTGEEVSPSKLSVVLILVLVDVGLGQYGRS